MRPPPCVHRGPLAGETRPCTSCPHGRGRPVATYSCALHGTCTADAPAHPAAYCKSCPDREEPPRPPAPKGCATPAKVTALDARQLQRSHDGTHFNASLLRHEGKLLLAYRTGQAGSNLHLAGLNEGLVPVRNAALRPRHPRCSAGREDPRLFVHRGVLHCAFVGVELAGGAVRTSQCYARLDGGLRVEAVAAPDFAGRQEPMEKNWAFFSHEGELYAVYSVRPHRILHLTGGGAFLAHETPGPAAWTGGHLRGGASPVRVGDEYWHAFHGCRQDGGLLRYNVGFYAFEARPPFRVTRYTPEPVLWADDATAPAGWGKSVRFVCGSVLEGGVWRLSMGVHDRSIEIAEFAHQGIENAMVKA